MCHTNPENSQCNFLRINKSKYKDELVSYLVRAVRDLDGLSDIADFPFPGIG